MAADLIAPFYKVSASVIAMDYYWIKLVSFVIF